VSDPAPSSAAWEAYRAAYAERYDVEPVRNARVNGQLAQLVARVGAKDAPGVARFFVEVSEPFYVRRGHPVGLLLRDAESLHMQWRRGRRITRGDAEAAGRADELRAQSQRIDALRKEMP
jgi:hypothetical protein